MKKMITLILFVLFSTNASMTHAQGQLTPGVQTSNLTSSTSHWVQSTSDKNKQFHASAYWVGGVDCGNYLKVYNGTTFAATSPQVLISTYHAFTRIRLDQNNNVYVLYKDRTSTGSTTFRTYLKKYNSSGTQIGGRIQVANTTLGSDIEVAPNGDVLIGCVEGSNARIKIYRNMNYKGFIPLENVNTSQPFVLQMDMKDNKFVVGYSKGYSSPLKIKHYTYVPNFLFGSNLNLSTLNSSLTETGTRFNGTNNQIALRTNGDIFYVTSEGNPPNIVYKTKKLIPGSMPSVFQTGNAKVDVDINNRLIISKNYGTLASENNKVQLFSDADALLHEYDLSSKIKNHLSSIAIYDCEFLVTGIDRKLGGNPLSYSYESFHQVFNCKDCRPNMGATAVAKFRYPYAVNQVPSKYGPLDVTELCLVDNLLVDGSLSSCENRYFVGLSEFNPMTWTDTSVLHSGWVYPLTQAPNNINIVDFLPSGYHLRPGKIYKFRLAVGLPWDAVDIFFEVSCCKRRIIVYEEDQEIEIGLPVNNPIIQEDNPDVKPNQIVAHPNPVNDELTLDFSAFKSDSAIPVQITTQSGTRVFSKEITTKKTTINTSKWPTGLYICIAQIDGESFSKKIIKK
ncbi:T9SS type A sorting domain-containing protein [Lacinutrix sp. Hel_I_90]|uniref:T9SS type A sorting domain-containing protein n=1 Tax=Lacinutrix sp. Hel_I_90 TaxID=1249999 RepID=UPI0009E5D1D7|nr:T9SS type A sorting domain-containing protein [Lacinutrix sp. Hel_I_90]